MQKSRLPEGGENLFQRIKAQCAVAEAAGVKLYRLSIGQPSGPALFSAREAAAKAIMSGEERMHEYQDNGSPGVPGFAKDFVQAHIPWIPLRDIKDIAFLPTPGIKPMLGLIPMACGGINGESIYMYTMTNPGYPTPAVWANYHGMIHSPLATSHGNKFLFSVDDINPITTDLIMVNYPHNPSGQVATTDWWERLCAFCEEYNIRLFNDAAYAILAHTPIASTLTEVAIHYPKLSWVEAFSASKVIGNGTGWRVGAICGSPDFVGDIATIKGNTDSGFFAPAAAGVIAALKIDRDTINGHRDAYAMRIKSLLRWLSEVGMRIAVEPLAGFFTLWLSPKRAFGQDVANAEEFNNLMIQNAGIVGVPFGRYIRYAVTSPIEKWEGHIRGSFAKAEVSY